MVHDSCNKTSDFFHDNKKKLFIETASIRTHEIGEGSNLYNRNQSFDLLNWILTRKVHRAIQDACVRANPTIGRWIPHNWMLRAKERRRERARAAEEGREKERKMNLTVSLATVLMTTTTQLLSAKYRGEILRRHERSDDTSDHTVDQQQSIIQISYDFLFII